MPHTFQSWRENGNRFEHGGHTIFYQAASGPMSGSTLLCIHGLPTASWDWHRLWPQLTRSFERVLAPDMIGFGFSDKPVVHAYSIFDQADLHERLLRQHGSGALGTRHRRTVRFHCA
jgi:pimeloyl-ACP methyl ester carboxylesterase